MDGDTTTDPPIWGGAPYNHQVCYTFGAITDGLSNTIAQSEILFPDDAAASPQAQDVRGDFFNDDGGGWAFMTLRTPNTSTPDEVHNCNDGVMAPCIRSVGNYRHNNIFSARSAHIGGVNASHLDGSVTFYSSTISLANWQAVGTSAYGESASIP
jgi:hypothetical protein